MGGSRQHRQKLYEKLVGQNIAGRFEIIDLIGFGGMGAVYRAVQQNMQRDVALKVIPSHDPTTAARFEREALTISKLHHPNTVTVFDYGQTDDGLLFLAMEMLSGRTLSDLIVEDGPLEPARVVHIADQVCRSLSEAHERNIVHRDIKPDNIFLIEVDDDPDFVKVLDFGIAKIVRGDDNVDLTGTGRIIGTPKYMSPEQILAEAIDHRSDLYSLGCIVFEMLCGCPPFQDSSTTKLMLAHAHKSPPTFAERLPNHALSRIPGPLEQVVRRALAKSRAQRQTSIDDFRTELEVALEATDQPAQPIAPDDVTEHRTTPAQETGGATDSSDLLTQHSSQTLAELDPPSTGERDAPASRPPTAETPDSGDRNHPELVQYGIVSLVAVAAVFIGYILLVHDGGSTPDRAASAEQPEDGEVAAGAEPGFERSGQAKGGKAEGETTVRLRVMTEPDGANVFEEGRLVGKTPMTTEAKAGDTLEYRFERKNYREKKASFEVDGELESDEWLVALDKQEAKPSDNAANPKRSPQPRVEHQEEEPAAEASSPSENVVPDDVLDQDEAPDDSDDVRPKVDMLDDGDDGPTVPTVD